MEHPVPTCSEEPAQPWPCRSPFEEIFTFPEMNLGADSYNMVQQSFDYDPETGSLSVRGVDSCQFAAGFFKTPSLEELRQRMDLDTAAEALGKRPLMVSQEVDDISGMHVRAENRYAVFQAASQFNTLEHTSQRGIPEHGITCYSGDRTQGPACATACAPGTIVRNYFAFAPAGKGETKAMGQTTECQVTNLGEVEEELDNAKERYFYIQNGYTLANDADLRRLCEKLKGNEALCERIRCKLRIGVQEDTEVVCSRFGSQLYKGNPGEQLVTQAYCSAVAVSYSRCSGHLWEPFARLILESLYEATLYAAVENVQRHPNEPSARKVFLTAVGGGVFGNDMRWVKDAMYSAFRKFKDIGLEIVMVSYGGPTREFSELVESFKP